MALFGVNDVRSSRSIDSNPEDQAGFMTIRTTKRSIRARPRGGFTLIEILVVIAVISLLAALVAPNVFQQLGTAKDATARSQIEMLGAALDAYRLDNGRYPSTDQGLSALYTEPTMEPRPTNWRGPYLRKQVPNDPWGNPYVYTSPGSVAGYDIVSLGADGAPGGEGENADIAG